MIVIGQSFKRPSMEEKVSKILAKEVIIQKRIKEFPKIRGSRFQALLREHHNDASKDPLQVNNEYLRNDV